MTRPKCGTRAVWFGAAVLLMLAACAGDEPTRSQNPNPTPGVQTNALSCVANAPRACPCVGQGMGMQLCNATGNGYGACTGCPPPAGVSGAGGTAPAAAAGAGGAAPGSGGSAALPPDAGAMNMPDGGRDAGDGEPTPSIGAVRGVSCGVGLPTLCEIGKQKCCVRSLKTDTCIDESAMCDCGGLMGCTVMQTHCDGPEDCAMGQVCCGTLAQNSGGYTAFECAAQCQATGQQRVACHEGETMCPSGLTCANSQLLTNVQICIDPASIEQ
jgi:hypothetical protein